jgi:hypothetical protein
MAYINKQESLPSNFLYYWLISFSSFFQPELLRYSSTILLGLLVVSRYIIVYVFLRQWYNNVFSITQYNLISLSLIFLSSIFLPQLLYHRAYLGSFTPNIWHNSTTIAVMPFALLLFYITVNQIKKFSWHRLIMIIVLVNLNASIKPSYLFVYACALPLTLVICKGLSRSFFLQVIPSIAALLIIYILSVLIYQGEDNSENIAIQLNPFFVYASWHNNPSLLITFLLFLASILTSWAFPLYVFLKKGVKKNDIYSVFSIIGVIGALIISILFAETGIRTFHGNFFWQVYISSFIFFLVAVKQSIFELTNNIGTIKIRYLNAYQILFGLHLSFGILYILKLLLFRSFF